MPPQKRVLYCHCVHAGILPPDVKQAVLKRLCESGLAFTAVRDLCGLAARQDPLLKELTSGESLQIAACHPRALQWLFSAAQAPLRLDPAQFVNLRIEPADKAADTISPDVPAVPPESADRFIKVKELLETGHAVKCSGLEPEILSTHSSPSWVPWFPVINYDRCTQCMQCLSFCLFGVFGVDSQGRIAVQQPEQCKTNCPACSRVCPQAAIIFPKYASGPINGEPVNSAALEREKMKVDVSALLGGDVYQMLRDRSERARSRFSKERDSEKALQERQRCVARLLEGANIPPEVLKALPSPEEIQRRAAEAMAKARAAKEKARAK